MEFNYEDQEEVHPLPARPRVGPVAAIYDPTRSIATLSATAGVLTTVVVWGGRQARYSANWKFRAIGQGQASGLQGIALDYGVHVG